MSLLAYAARLFIGQVPYVGNVIKSVYPTQTGQFHIIPPFRVLLVTPVSSNHMRVYFSEEPRHASPLGPTDVQNRLNWVISVLSGSGTTPIVEDVENVQKNPLPFATGAWSVDLVVDRKILAPTTYLVVASAAIVAANGTDLLGSPPNDRGSAPGIMAIPPRQTPQLSSSAGGIDFFYDFFKGTYQTDGKNDVTVHAGNEYLKKRILRRLISSPGGFFHLSNYGVGLRSKELFDASGLGKIRQRVLDQVLQEDDVQDVQVSVASPAAGELLVFVEVHPKSGIVFTLNLDVPQSGPVILT